MNSLEGRSHHDPVTLEVVDESSRGLSLSFVWHVDRYAHTIALAGGGRLVPLMASLEGAGDDLWPASPPLQSLTVEERPGHRRAILLVGMAGRSHWSLCALCEGGEPSRDPPAIVMDVACRVDQHDGPLTSRYRSMIPAAVEPAGQVAHLDISGCRCRLEILSAGDIPATLQRTENGLSIVAPPPTEPPPTTIRWKYRAVFVDPSDGRQGAPRSGGS